MDPWDDRLLIGPVDDLVCLRSLGVDSLVAGRTSSPFGLLQVVRKSPPVYCGLIGGTRPPEWSTRLRTFGTPRSFCETLEGRTTKERSTENPSPPPTNFIINRGTQFSTRKGTVLPSTRRRGTRRGMSGKRWSNPRLNNYDN